MKIRLRVRETRLTGLARELEDEERPRITTAVDEGVRLLGAAVRQNLSRAGSPAAPGEPPAKVEGELLGTVSEERAQWSGDRCAGAVLVTHESTGRLEYGGTDSLGRKIHAHPFVRPALARVAGALASLWRRA